MKGPALQDIVLHTHMSGPLLCDMKLQALVQGAWYLPSKHHQAMHDAVHSALCETETSMGRCRTGDGDVSARAAGLVLGPGPRRRSCEDTERHRKMVLDVV